MNDLLPTRVPDRGDSLPEPITGETLSTRVRRTRRSRKGSSAKRCPRSDLIALLAGAMSDRRRARPRQDPAGACAGAGVGRRLLARAVHPDLMPQRCLVTRLRSKTESFTIRRGPIFTIAARRRNQSCAGENPVGAARSDAGTTSHIEGSSNELPPRSWPATQNPVEQKAPIRCRKATR